MSYVVTRRWCVSIFVVAVAAGRLAGDLREVEEPELSTRPDRRRCCACCLAHRHRSWMHTPGLAGAPLKNAMLKGHDPEAAARA